MDKGGQNELQECDISNEGDDDLREVFTPAATIGTSECVRDVCADVLSVSGETDCKNLRPVGAGGVNESEAVESMVDDRKGHQVCQTKLLRLHEAIRITLHC